MGLFDFFSSDIAIDLGTANTLLLYKGKVVVDEPSIIAIDKVSQKVIAIGKKAMQMHEKTHENIKTIRPLKDGVIADFYADSGHDQTHRYGKPFLYPISPHGNLYSLWYY